MIIFTLDLRNLLRNFGQMYGLSRPQISLQFAKRERWKKPGEKEK